MIKARLTEKGRLAVGVIKEMMAGYTFDQAVARRGIPKEVVDGWRADEFMRELFDFPTPASAAKP